MTIRSTTLLTLAALAALPLPAVAQDFASMSCPQLWYARNAMLKAHRFCFTEPRAVKTFGNDGCSITMKSRVPLTERQRGDTARIVLTERIKLCP